MATFTVNGGSVEDVYKIWVNRKSVPEGASDNAQCALLVQTLTGAPEMASWTRGKRVKGGAISPGTAVATFEHDGTYDGKSGVCHAAIFVKEYADGIEVWDQWKNGHLGQRKLDGFRHGRRKLRFRSKEVNTKGYQQSNDGDALYVIEA
jgi:hypothetical protein